MNENVKNVRICYARPILYFKPATYDVARIEVYMRRRG